eukprot:CAMPEP_0180261640 /NCGR_PEP_ID=MMETSP0987-20121128/44256_1 /TAXON_ID=697907 /ORGANISM="non described non described, Strain CCMP2293" /LENGTH=183 /DNA_ID=CAMNT_0022231617 /DNA_START=100 /DNA_END=647 /DNA_ORIENTATION=+
MGCGSSTAAPRGPVSSSIDEKPCQPLTTTHSSPMGEECVVARAVKEQSGVSSGERSVEKDTLIATPFTQGAAESRGQCRRTLSQPVKGTRAAEDLQLRRYKTSEPEEMERTLEDDISGSSEEDDLRETIEDLRFQLKENAKAADAYVQILSQELDSKVAVLEESLEEKTFELDKALFELSELR